MNYFSSFLQSFSWVVSLLFICILQWFAQGRVSQKLSSRGKYVSVNIGPIRVVSSEQVTSFSFIQMSLPEKICLFSEFVFLCSFHFCTPLCPIINKSRRFIICPKINNILHKHRTLFPNAEANHRCMQTITAKSKKNPPGKKRRWGCMCLLPMFLICPEISRNLFIMGQRE